MQKLKSCERTIRSASKIESSANLLLAKGHDFSLDAVQERKQTLVVVSEAAQ